MRYSTLGADGPAISRIGFGCAAIGGYDYGPTNTTESVAAIVAALEAGITLFDTADVYGLGHSEELLASALHTHRTDTVIATKGGVAWDSAGRTRRDLSPNYLRHAIDSSLRRLRRDRIDLYQLHWPDSRVPIADSIGELVRARDAGKLQSIGLCNFPKHLLHEAAQIAPITAIQVPRSLLEAQWQPTIDWCTTLFGSSVLCYNVLAQGLFSGKYNADSAFTGTDLRGRSALFRGEPLHRGLAIVERLRQIAAKHSVSPSQVAISAVLAQPGVTVALAGIKSPAQAAENAAAADLLLDPEDLHLIAGSTA